MNSKFVETSSISCNCFTSNYEGPTKRPMNDGKAVKTSSWEEKVLFRIAKEEHEGAELAFHDKGKKRSLKKDGDKISLEASKRHGDVHGVFGANSLDKRNATKNTKQYEHVLENSMIPPFPGTTGLNRILPNSKLQTQIGSNLEQSSHNRIGPYSGNLIQPQACKTKVRPDSKIYLPTNFHQSHYDSNISPIKKQNVKNDPQAGTTEPQKVSGLTQHPIQNNTPFRVQRKNSVKEDFKQLNNSAKRSVGKSHPTKYLGISPDGSMSSIGNKLIRSTANKTLMIPREIQSVIDSDEESEGFSEVIMDMQGVNQMSQIEKITPQEALKNVFMKGTMMGTNATQSYMENRLGGSIIPNID